MFSINIQNHLRSKNIKWVLNNLPWPLPIIKLIKEKYKEQLAYIASFINQNVSNIQKPFILNAKQVFKKWKALKKRFKDLNPAAVTNIMATFFIKRV